MTSQFDFAVIGAGPAGLAAAALAREAGLSVVVLDEQAEPGGQIYRNVARNSANGQKLNDVLGPDYMRGAALVDAFRDADADYRAGASAWQVDPDLTISLSQDGVASQLSARRILIATGALERPVPIPGWTLPGVMAAGAAQVMLKASGAAPQGRVVIAGSGPLLLLVARQLVDAGASVAAVLETTRPIDYLSAAGALPKALRASGYLKKGLAMRRHIRAAGVPVLSGVRGLAAGGGTRVETVRYQRRGTTSELPVDALLLHEGVVPNVQITRQLGCAHEWVAGQRYWRPVLDTWYNTTVAGVSVAGDSAGIYGAEPAALAGRIAALDAACALGAIPAEEREARAVPIRQELDRHMAIRPLLDALFRPNPEILVPPDDATVVCRCEEVTAGTIREGVALGGTGPNQLKAYMRCGMGPCQGRLCGLTVSEIIAAARGKSVPEIGYYRIRPPIKPVTLGELAAFDE